MFRLLWLLGVAWEKATEVIDRRSRAEAEGWAGEIEGIDVTRTFLRAKREDTQRRTRRPTGDLGIPTRLAALSPEST